MKQTSSALTFLMAQYRAIFKRAYVKGIATAVLLTAGLAAGQAQAAGITWGNTNDTTKDVIITDTQTESGGKDVFAHDLTITGTGNLTVSGQSTRPVVNHNMTLQSGAQLTVDNSGSGIQGTNDITNTGTNPDNDSSVFNTANTTFSATGSTIHLNQQSSIVFTKSTITDSTVNLASGACIAADAGEINRVDGRGQLTLDGGTFNLTNGAQVYGLNVDVLEGTNINTVSGTIVNSNLYAGKDGVLNFAGTLNNVSGGYIMLTGGEVHIQDGAEIQDKGILGLGYSGQGTVYIEDGSLINHTDASNHMYAGTDIIMTGGTLTLANTNAGSGSGFIGSSDYQENKFDVDFTATGGEITINRSQIQMNNITLGGDVEVTLGTNIGDVEASYWNDNSLINAEDNSDGKSGVLTINGASITMNAGSSIMGREVNLNAGAITLNGTDNAYNQNESGSTIIRAYGENGVLNLAGGSIAVDEANEHGALRGKTINLTGTSLSIAANGELTIAGGINRDESSSSGANVVSSGLGATFKMTGGSINNAGTLNLGVVSGDGVNNSGSVFTIAGGTFTNTGTTNVGSGSTLTFNGTATAAPVVKNTGTISVASGASFNTDGTVTIGSTTDAGSIKFATGASGTFAGENVVLNNKIDIATGSTVEVAGNVTFNGDNSATNKVDLTGAGTLTLNAGSTLTINDAANTLGLTYTVADDSGSFTKGSGAAGFSGAAGATLYLDVTGMTGLDGKSFDADGLTALKTSLTKAIGSGDYTVNFQGISIDLASGTISSGNSADYSDVEDFLISGVETDELKNTSVAVTGSTEVQGSVGQVTTDGTNVIVADKTLTLNGHATTAGGEVASPVLTQTGTDTATATVAGVTLGQGSVINAQVAGSGVVGAITTTDGKGSVVVGANTDLSVVKTGTAVSAVTAETPSLTYDNIGTAGSKVYSVQVDGALTANEIHTNSLTASGAVEAQDDVVADSAQVTGSLNAATLTTQNATVAGTVNVTGTINAKVAGTNTGVFAVEDTGSVVALPKSLKFRLSAPSLMAARTPSPRA